MVELLGADDGRAVRRAVSLLGEAQVVAIPTDTVYGVAVDPSLRGATDRLFEAKRRPRDVTLPVFVDAPTVEAAAAIAEVTPLAASLIESHWPGGLTIVLRRLATFAADLGENVETVGVRCPDHPYVRALCTELGRPLAVTSANLHGEPTAVDASGIVSALGGSVALVVDGGRCEGDPSTVVDATGDMPMVLRQGALRL